MGIGSSRPSGLFRLYDRAGGGAREEARREAQQEAQGEPPAGDVQDASLRPSPGDRDASPAGSGAPPNAGRPAQGAASVVQRYSLRQTRMRTNRASPGVAVVSNSPTESGSQSLRSERNGQPARTEQPGGGSSDGGESPSGEAESSRTFQADALAGQPAQLARFMAMLSTAVPWRAAEDGAGGFSVLFGPRPRADGTRDDSVLMLMRVERVPPEEAADDPSAHVRLTVYFLVSRMSALRSDTPEPVPSSGESASASGAGRDAGANETRSAESAGRDGDLQAALQVALVQAAHLLRMHAAGTTGASAELAGAAAALFADGDLAYEDWLRVLENVGTVSRGVPGERIARALPGRPALELVRAGVIEAGASCPICLQRLVCDETSDAERPARRRKTRASDDASSVLSAPMRPIPSAPSIHSGNLSAPSIQSGDPSAPSIQSGDPSAPSIQSGESSDSSIQSGDPSPVSIQSGESSAPSIDPNDSSALSIQSGDPSGSGEQTHDVVRVLACTHAFHAQCIDEWLAHHNSCPICRREAVP